MANLKPILKTSLPDFTVFDRDSLNDDIISKIQSHEEWNEIWDGELLQNGSYAIINFFSYLFSKNAESFTNWAKQSIFTYADDPDMIVAEISKFGLSVPQTKGASVELKATAVAPNYIFSAFSIPSGFPITATGLNGNPVRFEIYPRSEDNPSQPDYISATNVDPSINSTLYDFHCVAFAGQTQIKEVKITDETREKFILSLTEEGVIEGSVQIYYDLFGSNQTKLIPVNSFVRTRAYNTTFNSTNSNGIPMFKVVQNDVGNAQIVFGTKFFGGDFPPFTLNSDLTIFYRTGGGSATNITKGAINQIIPLEVQTNRNVSFNFVNQSPAFGGADIGSISEEQFYAPHRLGKSGAIVSDVDALNILRPLVSKHEVYSPKYSEISNKVNILHTDNYIVPFRDFSDFTFPTPSQNETVSSYYAKFLKALNEFCNIDKIHDGEVENEFITSFIDADFGYTLNLKKPMSGSLFVSAYDQESRLIDRLFFSNNYIGSDVLPDYPVSKAFVRSEDPIGATVVTNARNKLIIKIDENINDSNLTANNGYIDVFVIGASYGVDSITGGNIQLAEEIDRAIKNNSITSYYRDNFPNHKFCYVDIEGHLILESPTTGKYSVVEIFDNSLEPNTILDTIKFVPQTKRPSPDSGLVFSNDSRFNYILSALNIKVDREKEPVSKDFPNATGNNWDNPLTNIGMTRRYKIDSIDKSTIDYVKPNTSISITAFSDSISSSVLDKIEFNSIEESETNEAVVSSDGTGNVFDVNGCNYNFFTGEFTIKYQDNTGDGILETNGFLTTASNVIEEVPVSAFKQIRTGQSVVGLGVPANTTIIGYSENDQTITISNNATETSVLDEFESSSPAYIFTGRTTSGSNVVRAVNDSAFSNIQIGHVVSNPKFPLGTTVTGINLAQKRITLSNVSSGTLIGTGISIDPSYWFPSAYSSNTRLRISYQRKIWNYMTVNYRPNPYFAEGEGEAILSYLKGKDKKLVGVEPLLKKVRFFPIKVIAQLTPIPGANRNFIRTNSTELVERLYGFNSQNPDHTIGSGFSRDKLKAFLTDSANSNIGVNFGEVIAPENNTVDGDGNAFHFVLPSSFISRIVSFETTNTQISGFHKLFDIEILVTNAVI